MRVLRVKWTSSGRDEIDYDILARRVEESVQDTLRWDSTYDIEELRLEWFEHHLREALGISTYLEQDFSPHVHFSFEVTSYESDMPNISEFHLGKIEEGTDGLFDEVEDTPIDFRKPLI